MLTLNTFRATESIAQNTRGGTELLSDAQDAIASFTTMWNFFESTLCANHASVTAFERVCERFQTDQVLPATMETLDECLAFWRRRYITVEGFTHRFEGLHFRLRDRKEHVEAVLQGVVAEPTAKLLTLMIITYRLRNNLFHGLKTIDMLNDQVQNLDNASRCLAAVLEAIPSRFVTVRHVREEKLGATQ